MWVFGYGSLMWKVDFPVSERVPGCIKGYVRRFWQGSHDHRGTPDAPGRVVTLIPYNEWITMEDEYKDIQDPVTWGIAYKIPDQYTEQVKTYLDFREKDGYSCIQVGVYDEYNANQPIIPNALCYVAHTNNESFHGYKPIHELALQIVTSLGPSGPNDEYLLNLAKAMRELAPNAIDHHLFTLEELVIKLRLSTR